jgi:hypothetical protein
MLFLTSVIFGMYADDSYSFVQKDEMDRCIIETEGQVSHAVSELFLEVIQKNNKKPYINYNVLILKNNL